MSCIVVQVVVKIMEFVLQANEVFNKMNSILLNWIRQWCPVHRSGVSKCWYLALEIEYLIRSFFDIKLTRKVTG